MNTINLGLIGADGKMGINLQNCIQDAADFNLQFGLVKQNTHQEKWIHNTVQSALNYLQQQNISCHLIIDFSSTKGMHQGIRLAKSLNCAFLSGTTNLSSKDFEVLAQLSQSVPVFWASNTSLGIAILNHLARELTILSDGKADIDIIETHHKHKKDAPSGTAKTLAHTITTKDPRYQIHTGNLQGERSAHILNINSLRAGDIIGTHDVHFTLPGEQLTLSHQAIDRSLFAKGALSITRWLCNQPSGTLYTMNHFIQHHLNQTHS